MLAELTALHLHRMMSSGRNKPSVFGCVDSEGKHAGDYVVKLSGAMETRMRGPASELIASCLARHFGILRPDPAAVRLHPDLVKWLTVQRKDLAHVVGKSTGLNFGTRLLTDVAIWPVGRALPEAMIASAAHIFALDALIENDDRRRDNPNVLARGDDLFVIDHESAFAFLYLITAWPRAWNIRNRASLERHVFYYQLRKQQIDLTLFTTRLAELGDATLGSIIQDLPNEWRHEDLGRISAHLQNLRDHASEFERQVLERLA